MKQLGQKGFTLIEMLMVIMLVAILAAVAIPQFVDFRTEARNGAAQSALGALRTGIATQYGQMILRCNAVAGTWPTAAQVNANNVTTGGVPCTAVMIPNAAEQQFVADLQIPQNPWSFDMGAASRAVTACVGGGCFTGVGFTVPPTTACDGTVWDDLADSGWCYQPALGRIWANSSRNPTDNEWTF